MHHKRASALLIAIGASMLLAGLLLLPGSGAPVASAQPLPQQRPTLTPVPPTPTRRPAGDSDPTPAATGRITGTVIDLTSSAPAPGIAVQVGDALVTTDANGNYDRSGLPAGSYRVALVLASGQGAPEQAAATVALAAGATVVQHLAFRSPQPAAPTPTAAAVAMPVALPRTGAPAERLGLALGLGLAALALGLGLRMRRAEN